MQSAFSIDISRSTMLEAIRVIRIVWGSVSMVNTVSKKSEHNHGCHMEWSVDARKKSLQKFEIWNIDNQHNRAGPNEITRRAHLTTQTSWSCSSNWRYRGSEKGSYEIFNCQQMYSNHRTLLLSPDLIGQHLSRFKNTPISQYLCTTYVTNKCPTAKHVIISMPLCLLSM